MNRRDFIQDAALAASVAVLPKGVLAANGRESIRAMMFRFGYNISCEWLPEAIMAKMKIKPEFAPDLKLRFEEASWRRLIAHMLERRLNTVVIDVAEGLRYPSHPELAVEGSWEPERLKAEVLRLRKLGIEAIPKLNFSATHDGWMKDYHRMLTLPKWYEVAKDLIRDVYEVFDRPRFFHLGMDEEILHFGQFYSYFVVREGELWWHDFLYLVKCVEDLGARPWIWSDRTWKHLDEFLARCPKSVIQSNWYYDETNGDFSLDPEKNKVWMRLAPYEHLEKAGFDQIPCGTNWVSEGRKAAGVGADDVIGKLVRFCRPRIAPERLLGFMMAPWARTSAEEEQFNMKAIDLLADALDEHDKA